MKLQDFFLILRHFHAPDLALPCTDDKRVFIDCRRSLNAAAEMEDVELFSGQGIEHIEVLAVIAVEEGTAAVAVVDEDGGAPGIV